MCLGQFSVIYHKLVYVHAATLLFYFSRQKGLQLIEQDQERVKDPIKIIFNIELKCIQVTKLHFVKEKCTFDIPNTTVVTNQHLFCF